MDFLKFKMVSTKDHQSMGEDFETMIINRSHVVSIKPINMVVDERVIHGFWVRTSNGKKYRAVEIPAELKSLFGVDEFHHED